MVVGFILARAVCVAGFIRSPAGVQSASLGSFGLALVVVVFIGVHWFQRCRVHKGSFGLSTGGRWVHSAACWGWSGLLRFVGFIRTRPVGPLVYSGSLGSLWRTLLVVGLTRVGWVRSNVHWGSCGSLVIVRSCIGVVVFNRVI